MKFIQILVVALMVMLIIVICAICYVGYPYFQKYIDMKEKNIELRSESYVNGLLDSISWQDSVIKNQSYLLGTLYDDIDSLKSEIRARDKYININNKAISSKIDRIDRYINK